MGRVGLSARPGGGVGGGSAGDFWKLLRERAGARAGRRVEPGSAGDRGVVGFFLRGRAWNYGSIGGNGDWAGGRGNKAEKLFFKVPVPALPSVCASCVSRVWMEHGWAEGEQVVLSRNLKHPHRHGCRDFLCLF